MQCDPEDPLRVFVNNYLGGNFLSEDGGETWVSASKGYTGASVPDLAVAPGQPATVYAGPRVTLFRSDNGGDDWIGLANPSPDYSATKLTEIIVLAVDPADADHVLASGSDTQGVLYSRDGGQSWKLADLPGLTFDLAFAPSDSRTAYAALIPLACKDEILRTGVNVEEDCDQSWTGLYISRDGGETWTPAGGEEPSGLALLTLAVHPTDPDTVFASRANAEVLKTTDGGQSWTPVGPGLPSVATISIVFDPSNADTIFAGTFRAGVYRSTDGGSSWMQVGAGMEPQAEVRSLVVDPTDSQVVYAGDMLSGVYVSTDGGTTWRAINDGMYFNRFVVSLALSDDGTVLYAGVDGDGVCRLGTPQESPPQEPTSTPIPDRPTPTPVEEPTPTDTPAPAETAQPTVTPIPTPTTVATPTPEPSKGKGICGGAVVLPLALVGLASLRRQRG